MARGFLDRDLVAVAFGQLLDHDGVGAIGHHAAGEDTRGLSGADRAVERMACRDFADQRQRHRRLRDIFGAHRVAVHRRDRVRRLRAQGGHVGGQHTAARFVQGDILRRQRRRIGQHAGESFGNRHQGHELSFFSCA